MGTPDFAVPTLELLAKNFNISLVVTTPDKQAGRGLKLQPSPIKLKALELQSPIAQPISLKDPSFLEQLKDINPDFIVVVAFRIVPNEILSIPKYGTINLHPSLLPKYRGAGILTAPIINGDRETGISLIQLTKKLDAGPVIARRVIPLSPTETNESLATKIANEAALMLPDTLYQYAQGLLVPKEQDDSQATYVGLVRPQDARIDWRKSAQEIERLIRAMQPKPGAWTMWDGQRLKIIASQVADSAGFKPGRVEYVNNQLLVGTGQGLSLIHI